ncbi:MAG: hypothetical protein V4619_01620 [Bacteroidota bacterium]
MVINKTQQYKVLLLLAGYLFIVLNHIYFVASPQKPGKQKSYSSANLVPKGYDEFGRSIVTVKKIYKSVINRDVDDQQGKALHELYVAQLLYNVSLPLTNTTNLHTYSTRLTDLPVKRSFHLRI